MPKASRFSSTARGRIRTIALRIQSRIRKLGYTAQRLSRDCAIVAGELYQDAEPPTLSPNRISKILMNCQHQPGTSAAIVISEEELTILARALKCSVEWLSLQGEGEDPIVWNVLTEPERSTHVLHLLEEYEDRAVEALVWSEYPLCSFTSEEYMLAFNRAHFTEMDTLGVTGDKNRLVEFFNRTGRARRKRILQPNRAFTFTNLVYRSEIRRIAAGDGIYDAISKSVRKRSFESLMTVLSDPALRMNFVIVDDKEVGNVKSALRDYETVGVIGDFSLWNYHSGSIGWSENPRHVGHHRQFLSQLQQRAVYKDNQETVDYLKEVTALL